MCSIIHPTVFYEGTLESVDICRVPFEPKLSGYDPNALPTGPRPSPF